MVRLELGHNVEEGVEKKVTREDTSEVEDDVTVPTDVTDKV